MIFILVILLAITLFATIMQLQSDGWGFGWGGTAIFTGLTLCILLLFAIKWQPSSDTLTGYVYQRNNHYGYASYSLRFSQNAGMDAQPSFCVKADSEQDKKLSEVVGQDIKVQVSIPSKGIRLVNNPFECSSFATLDKRVQP